MTAGLEGKVAIVTGAAAGFGLAVAIRLTKEGARVVMVDRAAVALHEQATELAGAVPVVADVSREADVDSYVGQAVRHHGRVDLFFNNAGIEGRWAPMTELSVDEFDSVMAVNARGVFLGLRAVLRVMKPQCSGAIVNTASMAGIRGGPTNAPYVASKHAVVGLTRCAALEGAPLRDPGQRHRAGTHRHPDGAGPDRAARLGQPARRVRAGGGVGAPRQAVRHRR
jgi:NAD(P)-dependent dehydrogenase (short-subunit alcohol dehydrogenase family)